MSRIIDLKKHLPQVTKSEEMVAIMDSESEVFQEKWDTLTVVQLNGFIATADDMGLRWFERLLRITRRGTLEERRGKVHYEWNKTIIYTDRTLRELLNNLLGEDAYEIEFIYNDYEIVFEIFISKTNFNLAELFILLREIVPANEIIKFIVTMKEEIRIEETFEEYKIHHYKVGDNLYRCGTIYEQSPAMVVTENVEISGTSEVAYNRPVKTGETSAGNRADRS